MPNILEEKILFPPYDKIYSNKKSAIDNAATDNILIGRYVLVKYCETELTQARKAEIATMAQSAISSLRGDEKLFRENLEIDDFKIKDRLLLQKTAKETEDGYVLEYQEICYFNLTDIGAVQDSFIDAIEAKLTWNDTYLS